MLLNIMCLQGPCSCIVVHLHALQDRSPVSVPHGDEGGQHQILQFQPIFKFRNINFRRCHSRLEITVSYYSQEATGMSQQRQGQLDSNEPDSKGINDARLG